MIEWIDLEMIFSLIPAKTPDRYRRKSPVREIIACKAGYRGGSETRERLFYSRSKNGFF
jgi:hypothetical protein